MSWYQWERWSIVDYKGRLVLISDVPKGKVKIL